MNEILRILLIEDNPGDTRLIEEILKEVNLQFELKCVDRLSSGIGEIKSNGCDVILLDLGLPDSQGLATLTKLNEIKPEAPIIVFTGLADETTGIQAIKEGAQDYLIKGQVGGNLLARSIRYAVERKKAEEALQKSEVFTKDILQSVGEGFVVIDPEYKIISANRAYCEQTKLSYEDILGRHCYEVSHHINRPCFMEGEECAPSHTFKTGAIHFVVHTHLDKDINPVYIETMSFPMKDAEGKVTAVIETLNNVTEKRKLEDQLRHAQKMEAIGQLAGGIAHDFNNILTAIIGYASITQMKMKTDDPLRHNMDQMLISAERAANLTQSLLAFSRKQTLNPVPADLNEIIKKVEKFLIRIIGEDIELKILPADKDLTLMADTGQIEQVLMNLATNARDAMPKGGMLIIEAGTIDIDDEYVKAHGYGKPGTYALISVTDSGIGMDEKIKEKIFEPFFTTKEVGKGTGLGLSIVYGIIKQHEGYINCYSEPGKGTTFKIYLPLIKLGKAQDIKPAKMEELKGGTETILLAEDDTTVRELDTKVLEEFGYKVIEAADGEDAVNKFMENKDKISLLILDVIMPVMNGKKAYERMRKIKPDIKVVFVSGYPIYKEELAKEGFEFISKPTPPTALLKKVREVLDK